MRSAVGNAVAAGLSKIKMRKVVTKNNLRTAVTVARKDNPRIAVKPRTLIFGFGIDHQSQGVFSLNSNKYSNESLPWGYPTTQPSGRSACIKHFYALGVQSGQSTSINGELIVYVES